MHDEAIASYETQIHQMKTGHSFLRSVLGVGEDKLPKIGWQIDPFGPSSFTPALLELSGKPPIYPSTHPPVLSDNDNQPIILLIHPPTHLPKQTTPTHLPKQTTKHG